MDQRLHPSLLILVALGCGSIQTDPNASTNIKPVTVVRETCDDNPLLAGCPGAAGPSTPDPATTVDPSASAQPTELDLARAAAENILRSNCGQCHGSQLTSTSASGGMNYIEDIDQLVQNGKITPLDSDKSFIIRRMRDGSMPPASSTGPRPSDQDILTVAQFIDNPLFWPNYAQHSTCDEQSLTLDDVFLAVANDLRDQDNDNDLPFLRYVTLSNRYNSGVCLSDLDEDRWAISEITNMLSNKTRIVPPVAIDKDRLIYRINIRDYGWNRQVRVGGQQFQDGWEAIIANTPYAVPFDGPQAREIRTDTGTDVALINADALVDIASVGDLYYGLVGVDANQTLDAFVQNTLRIDQQQDIDTGDAVRAGTTRSRVSRQDRLIERFDIGGRAGAFWQSFDVGSGNNIFVDPFDFNAAGTEAIFTLPNGLLGFVIADQNGRIANESNLLLDTFQDDFVARTAVSCAGCHASGFNNVTDEVGPFAATNRRDYSFDEFQEIQQIYLSPADFTAQIQADSAIYQAAIKQVGIPVDQRDPVSNGFLRFQGDVDVTTAAGDLGFTADELKDNLVFLNPQLRILNTVAVSRKTFSQLFGDSMCQLQNISKNFPQDNFCNSVAPPPGR